MSERVRKPSWSVIVCASSAPLLVYMIWLTKTSIKDCGVILLWAEELSKLASKIFLSCCDGVCYSSPEITYVLTYFNPGNVLTLNFHSIGFLWTVIREWTINTKLLFVAPSDWPNFQSSNIVCTLWWLPGKRFSWYEEEDHGAIDSVSLWEL